MGSAVLEFLNDNKADIKLKELVYLWKKVIVTNMAVLM